MAAGPSQGPRPSSLSFARRHVDGAGFLIDSLGHRRKDETVATTGTLARVALLRLAVTQAAPAAGTVEVVKSLLLGRPQAQVDPHNGGCNQRPKGEQNECRGGCHLLPLPVASGQPVRPLQSVPQPRAGVKRLILSQPTEQPGQPQGHSLTE